MTTTTTTGMMASSSLTATETVESKMFNQEIAEMYDQITATWEDILGWEYLHHGFYDPKVPTPLSDQHSAHIRMIEECLRFAGVPEDWKKKPKSIVDVGCGSGADTMHLARKYGAQCLGINLSPVQVRRAQDLAAARGLADKVSFIVGDALQQPFPDGKFDLVWAMESVDHMPDRKKFVSELARVAAPGGTIIITAWCHRDLSSPEDFLKPEEKKLLDKIRDSTHLPDLCSAADHVKLLQSFSLQDIKVADWSQYVTPFWPAVIRSALSWKRIIPLLRSGWENIKGLFNLQLANEGFRKGVVKYTVITCRKPA
ncbi:PREDICTED: probable tocopherol O-methyltransferase, chloroplastic [Nelumbo nucifera]|uniref:Probable tocopherol O-methyltransferase, chloroplastic n=1 Tax=Nelumbo nucifera TaxID=4432 RepID=A0A1U7ZJE8_NELNU|nr:PREDICTED: probable tocopherol O-methyltransferase, chloroplastic [Nelumbo nucifera]